MPPLGQPAEAHRPAVDRDRHLGPGGLAPLAAGRRRRSGAGVSCQGEGPAQLVGELRPQLGRVLRPGPDLDPELGPVAGQRVAVGQAHRGDDRAAAPGVPALAVPAEVPRSGPGGGQAVQGQRGRPEPRRHRLPHPPQAPGRVDHQQRLGGQGAVSAAAPERRGEEAEPHGDHHPGRDQPPGPAQRHLGDGAQDRPGRRRQQVGGRHGDPAAAAPQHTGQPQWHRPPSRRPGQVRDRAGGARAAAAAADLGRRPPRAAVPEPVGQARADGLQVRRAAVVTPGPAGRLGRPRTPHGSPPAAGCTTLGVAG